VFLFSSCLAIAIARAAHILISAALTCSPQSELAAEHLTRAVNIFRELGAHLDLEYAEAALAEHDQTPPQQERRREAAIQLITLRLAEAVSSRALLLRELAAVIRQETSARQVMVLEPDEERKQNIVVAHGYDGDEANAVADDLSAAGTDADRERFAKKHDAKVITLKSTNSLPASLVISPRDSAELSGGLPLDPLLRVVELGMDVCALRAERQADKGLINMMVAPARDSCRAHTLESGDDASG